MFGIWRSFIAEILFLADPSFPIGNVGIGGNVGMWKWLLRAQFRPSQPPERSRLIFLFFTACFGDASASG